jgi:hypothetical protein
LGSKTLRIKNLKNTCKNKKPLLFKEVFNLII